MLYFCSLLALVLCNIHVLNFIDYLCDITIRNKKQKLSSHLSLCCFRCEQVCLRSGPCMKTNNKGNCPLPFLCKLFYGGGISCCRGSLQFLWNLHTPSILHFTLSKFTYWAILDSIVASLFKNDWLSRQIQGDQKRL